MLIIGYFEREIGFEKKKRKKIEITHFPAE
jgi:hypothetical protein